MNPIAILTESIEGGQDRNRSMSIQELVAATEKLVTEAFFLPRINDMFGDLEINVFDTLMCNGFNVRSVNVEPLSSTIPDFYRIRVNFDQDDGSHVIVYELSIQ